MARNPLSVERWSRPVSIAALLIAVATAGCSADISRFDSPFFGLSDGGSQSPPRPTQGLGGGGTLAEQTPEPANGAGGYVPPPPSTARQPSMRTTALPDVAPGPMPPPTTAARPAPAVTQRPVAAPAQPRVQAPIAPGQTIDVQPGDTLYGISRRHGISVGELTSLNNLQTVNIRPGQKLVLPASAKVGPAAAQPIAPTAVVTPPPAARLPAPAPAPVAPPIAGQAPAGLSPPLADAEGNLTVRPGDSLFKIAQANKVSVTELRRVNNITNDRHVRVGTVLRMPGSPAAKAVDAGVAPAQPKPPGAQTAIAPVQPDPPAAPLPFASGRPTILNGARTQVAAVDPKATVDTAQPDAVKADQPVARGPEVAAAGTTGIGGTGKFRWPVNGRVVSGFGPRGDGTHNDGVDISVPLGTDVLAAEAGTVAYAGNELKGFGNLILVRHDNGFVSAYAHNDTLLVKRGDKVRRGQPLAKAGKSGQIDQPMVHFELRQGSKPVDPTPYMDKM